MALIRKTTSSSTTKPAQWLFMAFAAALIPDMAAATGGEAPMPQLRITEVTESSHPFETLHCARQPIQVRYIGNLAEVMHNGESRLLRHAISASGARYVALGDDSTELWGKGSAATLTWSGRTLPLCAPAGALVPPYRASGNEPFWAVTYDGWRSTLMRPGEAELEADAEIAASSDSGQTLAAGTAPDDWRLEVRDSLCIDSMSGMPHPQKATLYFQSETMHGCGGQPERLLQGAEWTISHIGDTSAAAAVAQIRFLPNGKIVGTTGCNRFFGQYTLTGESLALTDLGSTRMACPADRMTQEQSLLKALTSVHHFSFEHSDIDQMILHADGQDIRLHVQKN